MSVYLCRVHDVWTIACGHTRCQLLARIEAADELIQSLEATKASLLEQLDASEKEGTDKP